MDLIKFLFGAFLCIGGCIGLIKWIDTWGKEEEEEVKEEVKKKATPKIQAAIDYRELYLKKQEEDSEKEMRRYERERKLKRKFPGITKEEIDKKLKEEDNIYKSFFKYLYIGSEKHYFDFLDAYIESGGIPTHHREYRLSNKMIYIAKNQIEILPLYGSDSLEIIVMPNCKIIDGKPGHNNFYCYDDILNQKYAGCIPTYQDWAERFKKCI